MIESIEYLCHTVQKMPISEQLHWALMLTTVGGGIGITLREMSNDRELKIFGRLLGLGAYFVMASFGIHAAHVCENMNLVKQPAVGREVSLLADGEDESRRSPSSFPAVSGLLNSEESSKPESLKTYQFTSKEGHTLKWSCPDASAATTTRPPAIEFHALRREN
jgi:hypothetical protein